MARFHFWSQAGLDMGTWEGDTPAEAWGAMVADGVGGIDMDGNPTEGTIEDWRFVEVEDTEGDRRLIRILAHLAVRDERGRHFTATVPDADLEALEARGWIRIERPVHQPTGIPWAREYWGLEVTQEGQDVVDSRYDPRDED